MSKTPIMILQELGVKEGVQPNYDIICSQNGTHANIFTFRVKYNNLCADGTAPNKKQAKQTAAENMLKLLQEKNNISSQRLYLLKSCNSDVITSNSPSPSSAKVPSNEINYVGILQEYCAQNRLIEPEYQICVSDGPAHNMKFTMSCTLGSIIEEAVANTKKQAKQQVARKVLQKLPTAKNIPNSSQSQSLTNSSDKKETTEAIFQDLGIQIANLKIVDDKHLNKVQLKYLTAISNKSYQPLINLKEKVSVDTYHLYLKSMMYNKICNSKERDLDLLYKTLNTYAQKYDQNNLLVHEQVLKYIKETCKLPIERISLNGKNNMTIIGFRVNLGVPLVQFGMSKNPAYAEKEVLIKTIKAIILYLK